MCVNFSINIFYIPKSFQHPHKHIRNNMIISASRKTDIPAFYAPWFFERIRQGFCYVQNPRNAKNISKISLQRDVVDGIIFWTKNPRPMLERLNEIAHYPFYFQFTLTSYGQDMEAHLPRKKELVKSFQELARATSPHHVIWRYDPLILTPRYTVAYHLQYFAVLAKELEGYSHRVVFSFVEYYTKIAKAWHTMNFQRIDMDVKHALAQGLSDIARNHGFTMQSCATHEDFTAHGITQARCIDDALLTQIAGTPLTLSKDKGQRNACGCVHSVDIGMYNSCDHGCRYCYASYSRESVQKNMQRHNPSMPLLLGSVPEGVEVKEKQHTSFALKRHGLFDGESVPKS